METPTTDPEMECTIACIRDFATKHALSGKEVRTIMDIGLSACSVINLFGLTPKSEESGETA